MKKIIVWIGMLLSGLSMNAQDIEQIEAQADQWARQSFSQSKALSSYLLCLKNTEDEVVICRLIDKTTGIVESRRILMSKDAAVIDSIIDGVRPFLGKDCQHFLPLLEQRVLKSSNSAGKYQKEFLLYDEILALRASGEKQVGAEYEELLRWNVGKLIYKKDISSQDKLKAYAELWGVYRKNTAGLDSLDIKLLDDYSRQCSLGKDYQTKVELLELKKQYLENKDPDEYMDVLKDLQYGYDDLYEALYGDDSYEMTPEKIKEIFYQKAYLRQKESMGMEVESSDVDPLLYNLMYFQKDTSESRKVAAAYSSYVGNRSGKESEEYCKSLDMLVSTYDMGDAGVIPILKELLSLTEKVLGKDNLSYTSANARLTYALSQNHHMQESIEIQSADLNEDDISALMTLSTQQSQYGQYREAIDTYEKMLNYCASHPQDSGTYLILSVLGPINCYVKLNDISGLLDYGAKWTNDDRFGSEEQHFIFSQVVASASLPGKSGVAVIKFIDDYLASHPSSISSVAQRAEMMALKATAYLGMEDPKNAEVIIRQLISSLKNEKTDPRITIRYEQYLEICLMAQERWKEADIQNKRVLSLMSRLPGYKNYVEYRALCCRAAMYNDYLDNYDQVLELCAEIDLFDLQNAMSLIEDISFNTFDLLTTLLDKSSVERQRYRALYKKGMNEEAEALLLGEVDEKISLLKFSLSQMDNGISNATAQWTGQTNDNICNIAVAGGSENLAVKAFDYALIYKQAFLTAESLMRAQLLNSENEQVKAKFNELQDLRTIMQQHSEAGLSTNDLAGQITQLEAQLVEDSKMYGDFTASINLKWTDIRERLKPEDIVIEFVSYTSFEDDNEHIAALLLRKDWHAPKIVYLFSAEQVPDNCYESVQFSRLCWEPISHYLNNVVNIYFAPAGVLYNIGIESLMLPDGNGNISDRYNLFRVSSSRELVKHENSIDDRKGDAVIYGGINYQSNGSEQSVPEKAVGSTIDKRAAVIGLEPLPGSRIEAENIAGILKADDAFENAILFMESAGTESSFRSLSGNEISVLHIATHGFYNTNEESGSSLFYLLRQEAEDKVLARSGLFLAGAENNLLGYGNDASEDDGILTAMEISTLDFRYVDLATLSACQTAQGDITGDGVYGLQRGFKKAGAESILMSLWKVDDEATCFLMTEFYRNWIGEGKTKHAALEAAKQAVRSKKNKGWDKPEYWAAFILLDGLD